MTITYFGYGSLVNLDTIPANAEATPGKLRGWVREWRVCGMGQNGQGRCALSVREDPDKEIWGVMVREPRSRLEDLEKREKRYRKVEAVGEAFRCEAEQKQGPDDLFVFVAAPEHHRWGTEDHPILQSYLDCVLAGFFRFWGEDGIEHFLESTDGWHVPVLRDRHRPAYPRAVSLPDMVIGAIDEAMSRRDLSFIDMS
ncbi:gamma-glutamylcyclotransferase family protein [Roseibium sp. MMSF_3544]|uniref:gamma-glutamylcyclotransferase family protein n=1 Tax=unclassified Roseibium TaxID=2629323 RepID=UPI00273D53BC|nr:gamma-glutamylcyclotransferase family protein [Roseibium sp. MMSF_3544]